MEYQIQKNVINIYKKLPADAEPQSSLEEEDIKQYIEEVIREIKDHKIAWTTLTICCLSTPNFSYGAFLDLQL